MAPGRGIPWMFQTIAVTLFAGNAELEVTGVFNRAGAGFEPEGGSITFEASRADHAVKVDLAIQVTGAIDPRVYSREIRNRKLKQEAVLPIEIGLSFSSRPNHEIDALSPGQVPSRIEAGLIEATVAALHLEMDIGRPRAQRVMPFGKASLYRLGYRRAPKF